MAGNKCVMLLFATLVLATVFGISSAKSIVVGGTTGWAIPSSPSFYSDWASKQKFQVGDLLVFNFPAGAHTVAEVSKANYDSCATTNTIGQVKTTAPAIITLATPGTHYFICTMPGHCNANQKLTITVAAAAAAAPTLAPMPLSPTTSTVPMGPTMARGPGSAPPPSSGNFATSTVIGGLSLVTAIVVSVLLL